MDSRALPHQELDTNSNYYELLGKEEITKAYHRKCLEHHPDRNIQASQNIKKGAFSAISHAYAVLNDPISRAQYDRWLHSGLDVPFEVWKSRDSVAHWTEGQKTVKPAEFDPEERRKFRDYEI